MSGQQRPETKQAFVQVLRLRGAVLLLCLMPALWLIWQGWHRQLGPRPVMEAIHQSGDWAIRLLWLTLLVSPLRRLGHWPRLIAIRQPLGLAAFGYALLHLGLYVIDHNFDGWKIASEIVRRYYLTIGFAALIGLAALAATSGAQGVRRLGSEGWNRLHKVIYLIAAASVLHFFIQSKLDVSEPILMTGLFYLLMGYRGLVRAGWATTRGLAALSVAATLATMTTEVLWYRLVNGVPIADLISANFEFDYEIKAMWWILGVGSAALALSMVRGRPSGRTMRRDTNPSA